MRSGAAKSWTPYILYASTELWKLSGLAGVNVQWSGHCDGFAQGSDAASELPRCGCQSLDASARLQEDHVEGGPCALERTGDPKSRRESKT